MYQKVLVRNVQVRENHKPAEKSEFTVHAVAERVEDLLAY